MNAPHWALALLVVIVPPGIVPHAAGGDAPTTSAAWTPAGLVSEALDLMHEHSMMRDRIDWPAFRARFLAEAAGATNRASAHRAIAQALEALGDGHSFLNSDLLHEPEQAAPIEPVAPPPRLGPHGRMLRGAGDADVAYVCVPGMMGDAAAVQAYADELARAVDELARAKPRGWVVDVRGNWGGNQYPMIAGLGALLGPGDWGSASSRRGSAAWGFDGAAAYLRTEHADRVEFQRVTTLTKPAAYVESRGPIAYLVGPMTGSSGESIALALRGTPLTRSFGRATSGHSTSNEGFFLADGTNIVITVGVMRDRRGKGDGKKIEPDVVVGPQGRPTLEMLQHPRGDDPVIAAAAAWIDSARRPR
jgi:hypothetical protein